MQFRNDQTIGDALGVPRTMEEMRHAMEINYIIPAFRDGIVTVDKLLDHVDVVLEWYIPSEHSIDFMNFIRLVLGEEPENSNPKAHYFLIDCIFKEECVKPFFSVRNIDYDLLKDRVLVLASREFSKSTLLGSMLVLYMAARGKLPGFGRVTYMLYVSDAMRNNVKTTMETIGSVYRESVYLKNIFESARLVQDEINFVRKPTTKKEIAIYNQFVNVEGKSPKEVPGRMKRTFTMTGLGAAALPLDAKLYTEDGYTTIGECKIGDEIFGADGKLATITKKSDLFYRPMYRIILRDGRSIDVCEEHINSIVVKNKNYRKDRSKKYPGHVKYKKMNVVTKDLIKMEMFSSRTRNCNKHGERITKEALLWIENIKPIQYKNKDLDIDPYMLGLLIGDGTFKDNHMNILHMENKDFMEIEKYIPYEIGYKYFDKRNDVVSVNIRGLNGGVKNLGLRNIKCLDKHIPSIYLKSSVEQRLELLRGLMDSDGTVLKNGRTIFNTSSNVLAYQTLDLVRSLGAGATIVDRIQTSELGVSSQSYKVEFTLKDMIPFKLKRKVDRCIKNRKASSMTAIVDIIEIPLVPSQCIGVDNEEHQFITTDYVRTHNTGGRGSREGLSRPDGVFFDDMLGNETDANSSTILDNIESTIESDILPALSGNGSFKLFAGTPYNKNDPAYKRIEDGSWLPIVFPKAEKIDETVTKETFRGVWPDRHTFEACMGDYKKAKRAADNGNTLALRKLQQEYYLRISNDEDRMIPESLIHFVSRQDIVARSWEYNWYITTDYTTTGSKGSDMSCNMLWAVGSEGDFFLVDLILRKLELEDQYRETFAMVRQCSGNTRGVEVGVEVDGQQGTHILALKDRMPKNNTYFTMARQKGKKIGDEGIRSGLQGGNKHWRFRMMLPYFQNHKIHFAEELKGSSDMNELLEQIKYATFSGFGSKHDDGADGISQLGMIEILYPAKTIEEPRQHIGMKRSGINSKIWQKQRENDDEGTAYDSYA